MAINDIDLLPLKAARRDAIANFKCLWAPGHEQPNFDLFIYIRYAAPLFSARISAIYLQFGKVGWVTFAVCNAWQRSKMQNVAYVV